MTDKLKSVLKMFADFDGEELNKIQSCFRQKAVRKNHICCMKVLFAKNFTLYKRVVYVYFL